MKRIVIKFGGTSVMDPARITHVAEIVKNIAAKGTELVVVVSAMGHATDHLLDLAGSVSRHPDKRELDLLMTTGEQVSATLVTMAIHSLGLKAQSFTGAKAGIVTEKQFGSAKIKGINTRNIEECLKAGVIPVVAGFQGISEDGEITTLGRGGSDTTAIALAAALRAECCDIYTDVNGVYSADPRIVPNAHKIERIPYREMHEMALSGAQVLNARSVETAMLNDVPIRVRSTFHPSDEGTLVAAMVKQSTVTGISSDSVYDAVCISLTPPANPCSASMRKFRKNRYEAKVRLFAMLKEAGAHFERGATLKDSTQKIALIVNKSDADRVLFLLKEAGINRGATDISKSLVRVSLVSNRISSAVEVEAILALTKASIPISMITRHGNRLSFMVPESAREEAVKVLHDTTQAMRVAA